MQYELSLTHLPMSKCSQYTCVLIHGHELNTWEVRARYGRIQGHDRQYMAFQIQLGYSKACLKTRRKNNKMFSVGLATPKLFLRTVELEKHCQEKYKIHNRNNSLQFKPSRNICTSNHFYLYTDPSIKKMSIF